MQAHQTEPEQPDQAGSMNTPSYSEDTTPTPSVQTDKLVEMGVPLGNGELMNHGKALKPDSGTKADFKMKDSKFAFSPRQLGELLNPKNLSTFQTLGGLAGLEKGLRTDRQCGLSSDETVLDAYISFDGTNVRLANTTASKEALAPITIARAPSTPAGRPPDGLFADRKRVFQDNTLPAKKSLNFLQLMWMAYNDYVLFLLTAAAIVSLGIGLYQALGTAPTPNNPPVEWIEGVAIIIAIVIIVIVGSVNDYEKERQFTKLNKKKQDRNVKVIRSGKSQVVSLFEVLVGDVVHLESGDVIPADGIFIHGYDVKCDESSTTGESKLLRKQPGEEVFQAIQEQKELRNMDPFIVSGAKVAEGLGTFLVTATGVNSSYGKILMSLREEPSFTPLQSRLNKLAKFIAWFGGVAALLLFLVLFIKFLVQLPHNTQSPPQKGQDFLDVLIIALTVLIIAVPEGLPLAVTLALAFASNRMLKDNNLVRQLRACETMGNATNICSDKTGTLTQNKMTVVAGIVGTSLLFDDKLGVSSVASNPHASSSQEISITSTNAAVPIAAFVRCLIDEVKEMLKQSIVINSTAFEGEEDGRQTFIGSKTETALLTFARDYLGMGPVSIERSNTKIVQLIPFDAARQCMGTVVELKNNLHRLYVKGASEILLGRCTRIIQYSTKEVWDTEMTTDNTESLKQIIASYASRSQRTITLGYRDFEHWPPTGVRTAEDDETEVVFEDILKDLVFLGITGIQDPLRDGAQEAVQACQKAGVVVRMVTGDNILTAKAIAEECGILSASDIAMEGPEFRNLSEAQIDQIIPNLKVLARSSPEDKRILVTRLKEIGETVAVTGDGTNDALALAAADVGFSMGIAGTEVAKEASSIVLMDDNFSSIVKAIMWGRAVNDAVKKFLQVYHLIFGSQTSLTLYSFKLQSASPL
jgi:Ca2+-transporting ATPase